MDDSVEAEILLQFLRAQLDVFRSLSRYSPVHLETLAYIHAIVDRNAIFQMTVLFALIVLCTLLIKHPEIHSQIRGRFSLLPDLCKNIHKQYDFRKDEKRVSSDSNGKEWFFSDALAEVYAMQGHRPHMEDRFCILADSSKSFHIYGVFDGHGGEAAAEYANKKLLSAILDRLKSAADIDISQIQDILRQEILSLDDSFMKTSKISRNFSGTTCLVAVIFGDTLIVANVGDSRGVMATDKGRTVALSFDHKPQQIKEQKRIKEAGGFISFNGVWRVAGILATSRALGDYPLKDRKLVTAEPDILTFNLSQHESSFVVLATDGLWDTLSNEEVVAFLSEQTSLKGSCKELAQRAFSKGSQDNITVLLVDITKYLAQQKSKKTTSETAEKL